MFKTTLAETSLPIYAARNGQKACWVCCRQAGKWHEASHILQQLTQNAVTQHQYALAASLYHQMALEALDEVLSFLPHAVCNTI